MVDDRDQGLNREAFEASYAIERPLGRGAYGTVYLARQYSLGRLVAIKFFDPRRSENLGEDAARFVRETRLLGRLSHPHILRVFDANLVDEKPFLVTEYLGGSDLAHLLEPGKPMQTAEAVRICLAVAGALEYLHGEEIIHRDLKPENVLLGVDQTVKVSDFGLARPLETDEALTVEGTLLGTPAYLAPETVVTGKSGAASDIYALGVMLYQCFDGRFPFNLTCGRKALLTRKIEEDADPPGTHVPRTLASLMTACVSRSPELRPTAGEIRTFFAGMGGRQVSDVDIPTLPAAAKGGKNRSPTERIDRRTFQLRPSPIAGQSVPVARAAKIASGTPRGSRWTTMGAVAGLLAMSAATLLFLRGTPPGRSQRVESRIAPAGGAGVVAQSASRPLATRPQSPPAGPPRVEKPPIDAAKLVVLQRLLQAGRVDRLGFSARPSFRDTREALEKCGAGRLVRQILAAGSELPTGVVPAAQLPDVADALQLFRLLGCGFRASGGQLPPEYEQLTARAFPIVHKVPPGAVPVMALIENQPTTVPTDAEVSLGLAGEGYTMNQLPGLKELWRRRGPRRVWWVIQVRDLSQNCVLDLRLTTSSRPIRLSFVAPEKPVSEPAAAYNGVLALGFDSRLFDNSTGRLLFSYLSMDKRARAVPVLEKLALWE